MIEYNKEILGKRFLCRNGYGVTNYIFEVTFVNFSDNHQNVKWKNSQGNYVWSECDELTILDSISENDVIPIVKKVEEKIDDIIEESKMFCEEIKEKFEWLR